MTRLSREAATTALIRSAPDQRHWWRGGLKHIDASLALALFAALVLLVLILFGARLAPHESIYFVVEHGKDPRPYDPGVVFPFGSDVLGRDIFSLVLSGAPATLTLVLLSGATRLCAGLVMAIAARFWRPVALVVGFLAGLASAIPATIIALLIVKILAKQGEASVPLVVGALLVTGWAGPYSVFRAELERLMAMPFTLGAHALGLTRRRLILRHQLPHLVPLLALNLSQQIVAALVLVAELGVLGVYVGTTRMIDVSESLTHVDPTQVNSLLIGDVPEWGGLLASARSVESIWLTRWLIFVPGLAFAATSLIVAIAAFALARRYMTHDIFTDLRSRWVAFVVIVLVIPVIASLVVPDRYAAAKDWAKLVEAGPTFALSSTPRAFAEAGLLSPTVSSFAVERHVARVVQTAPATVEVAGVRLTESWPRQNDPPPGADMRSFVAGMSGGGTVNAPLVFASRGIVPSEYRPGPPARPYPGAPGLDLATQLIGYADDYASVDVKGKIAVLVRFLGIAARERGNLSGYTAGPDPDRSIAGAIQRGAAAVIFIDPLLPYYRAYIQRDVDLSRDPTGVGGVAQYALAERISPATTSSKTPVVVLDAGKGKQLLAPLGIDITPLLGWDDFGAAKAHASNSSRELDEYGKVSVPVSYASDDVTSYVGVTPGISVARGHVLLWAVRRPGATHPTSAVLEHVASALAGHPLPFVYVDFDPAVDAVVNAKAVADSLGGRRIALVVVLDRLDGSALDLVSPFGDLIPAFERYAETAGVPHTSARSTPTVAALGDNAPLPGVRTILITGNQEGGGDLRAPAAALVGYLAGRIAVGAEEVPK